MVAAVTAALLIPVFAALVTLAGVLIAGGLTHGFTAVPAIILRGSTIKWDAVTP